MIGSENRPYYSIVGAIIALMAVQLTLRLADLRSVWFDMFVSVAVIAGGIVAFVTLKRKP